MDVVQYENIKLINLRLFIYSLYNFECRTPPPPLDEAKKKKEHYYDFSMSETKKIHRFDDKKPSLLF